MKAERSIFVVVALIIQFTACKRSDATGRHADAVAWPTKVTAFPVARLWDMRPDPLALGRFDLRQAESVAQLATAHDWPSVLERIAWWRPDEILAALPATGEARAFVRSNLALALERGGRSSLLEWATDVRAERVQIALLRQAGVARRFSLCRSLSASVIDLSRRALKDRMPGASEREYLWYSNHR